MCILTYVYVLLLTVEKSSLMVSSEGQDYLNVDPQRADSRSSVHHTTTWTVKN